MKNGKKKVHTYIQKAIIKKNGKNHHNDVQYIMIMKTSIRNGMKAYTSMVMYIYFIFVKKKLKIE